MIQVNIPDLYAKMAEDPTGPVAVAFGAVLDALIAVAEGVEADTE